MRLTARAVESPSISAANSCSRKTVKPSFKVSWNQSRQVTRSPVQLWKYSCPITLSIRAKSRSVATCGVANTQRELKMFSPLFSMAPMVKSSVATIMKRSKSSSRPNRSSSQAIARFKLSKANSVLSKLRGSTQICKSAFFPFFSWNFSSRHFKLPATSAKR